MKTRLELGMADTLEGSFRSAMRLTATSVTLLTCRDADGRFYGVANSSVACLAMSPPSIMVGAQQQEATGLVITDTGYFCLNYVTEHHVAVVNKFAPSTHDEDPFDDGLWALGHAGLPYLPTALASLMCKVVSTHRHADHTVFIGEIEATYIDAADERNPLIWLNGGPVQFS
ncbi:flavin reductase family protein [Celeribacter sp.]|uniref:flavin reductase family protein n=1 Tax=Celeribacter sp. TaxID=1890673 RepID=UPI003A91FB98